MGSTALSSDSFIRVLPFSVGARLKSMLEPGQLWEKFLSNIPKNFKTLDKSDTEEFVPKYSATFFHNIALRGNRPGSSCTQEILQDWGTQNVRVKHLIKVLVAAGLYQAADYLSVDVLKGDPVTRPTTTESGRISDANNDSPRQSKKPEEQEETDTTYVRKHVDENPVNTNGLEQPSLLSMEEPRLSIASGCPSVGLKEGIQRSSSRIAQEDDEADEVRTVLEDLIIDTNIRLRCLDFKLLQHITNNFNDKELSAGGNLIGRGGFGTVYVGQFNNQFKIAVKCLKEENEDVLKQFKTELEVLSQYRHENIVHLLGYSQEDTMHCLIYQFMPNGSLEDRLSRKNDTPSLSCNQRIVIAKGTARGINYLNGKGLVHRDIKSANVLLDKDFIPKVGDFATARIAPKGTGKTSAMTNVVIGTTAYLAPEAYQFDVSALLDTFSYGVVLLELLTGLPSFDETREEKNLVSYAEEVMDENEDVMMLVDRSAGSWKESTAMAVHDLAQKCLQQRKKHRPLIEKILPEIENLTNE